MARKPRIEVEPEVETPVETPKSASARERHARRVKREKRYVRHTEKGEQS